MNSVCILVLLIILGSCWGTEVLQYEKPRSPSHHEDNRRLSITQAIISCLGLGYYLCKEQEILEYNILLYIPEVDTNDVEERTDCAHTLVENLYLKCTSSCKIIESTDCRLLISKLKIQERDLQDDGYAGIEHTLQDLDNVEQDIYQEKQIVLQDREKAPRNTNSSPRDRYHPYKRYIYFHILRNRITGMRSAGYTFSLERSSDNSIRLLVNGEPLGHVKSEDVSKFNGIDLQGKIPKIVDRKQPGLYFMRIEI